eukprot:14418835-Ditylum_brightwellii.AAC.1
MKESNCPLALWDYCVEQRSCINNLIAKDSFKLNGTTHHTALTGEEGDISSNEMAQWVMKGNCNVVPRQTLRLTQ